MSGLASFVSEAISDAEKRVREAQEEGLSVFEDYWEGQLHAFLEVEQFIANQENDE